MRCHFVGNRWDTSIVVYRISKCNKMKGNKKRTKECGMNRKMFQDRIKC